MCFMFIWEQTATCATYSINWLVFIIEMESVYSAVQTGSLNKAVCASSLKGSSRHWTNGGISGGELQSCGPWTAFHKSSNEWYGCIQFVYEKPTRCTISQHYFDVQFYMFRTDLLSIIRSLVTVFTVTGLCHTGYVDCLLAKLRWRQCILLASIIRIYHDARSFECQRLYTSLTIVNHLGCFYHLKDFALRSQVVKTNWHPSYVLRPSVSNSLTVTFSVNVLSYTPFRISRFAQQ